MYQRKFESARARSLRFEFKELLELSDTSDDNMEQLLEHIADEDEILDFHQWIRILCNPDSDLVQNSDSKFKAICRSENISNVSAFLPGKEATNGLMTSTDLDQGRDGQDLMKSLANRYVR